MGSEMCIRDRPTPEPTPAPVPVVGSIADASVSDIILEDIDEDGDGDEPIVDVAVTLIVADGVVVGTTTTGTDGTFVFDGVPLGTYTVVESTRSGFTDVTDSDGGDVTDSNRGDPNSITVTVAPGVDTVGLEFIDEEPSSSPSASPTAAPTAS